jgi:hypothetical protein
VRQNALHVRVALLFTALGIATGCAGSGSRAGASGPPAAQRGPSCEQAYREYVASTAFAQASKDARPEVPVEAYGDVLNYGSYFSHCPIEDRAEISICAAVQNGRALGVTVTTSPRLPEAEVCIDRAVRRLHFPPHTKMEVARTFFGAAGSPPWGDPRDDPATQAKVTEFLESVRAGRENAALLCAPTVVAMPELWSKLVLADPTLERRGIQTNFEIEIDGGRRDLVLRVLDSPPDIEALLKSPGLTDIARRLATARVRPAAAKERETIYKQQLVAFTPNTPVTVAEGQELTLALLLSEGKVYWMELIADRRQSSPPPVEAPPADSTGVQQPTPVQ